MAKYKGRRNIFESYKLYTRKNLFQNIKKNTSIECEYIMTFGEIKHAHKWIKNNGNINNVYLIEKWINDVKNDTSEQVYGESLCKLKYKNVNKQKHSFIQKWTFNNKNKWHISNYVHKLEYVK